MTRITITDQNSRLQKGAEVTLIESIENINSETVNWLFYQEQFYSVNDIKRNNNTEPDKRIGALLSLIGSKNL